MRWVSDKKDVLAQLNSGRPLIFDGAMGTYYAQISRRPAVQTETACLDDYQTIVKIHQDYLKAGAKAIKTNTFSLPSLMIEQSEEQVLRILDEAVRAAKEAAETVQSEETAIRYGSDDRILLFADLGPLPEEAYGQAEEIYGALTERFLQHGISCFLFETQSEASLVLAAAERVKEKDPESYVIASFGIGADGVSRKGLSGRSLLEQADALEWIDATGFNCMAGPNHLSHLIRDLDSIRKPISVMPNAGYPSVLGRRTVYGGSPEYFSSGMLMIAHQGASIIGGCCGTTPDHILKTAELISEDYQVQTSETVGRQAGASGSGPDFSESQPKDQDSVLTEPGILQRNHARHQKSFLVELDPPANDSISFFIEGVSRLKNAGADMITIADNPIGRPRADSSILACKIKREIDIEVLPHMTCRDRNLNAIKALLLGLSIEDVHHVLLVTGDPLPDEARNEVKAVFSFNSRTLARYVRSLGQDRICTPFHMLGALDLNARNFDVQLRLAKEKEASGICGFLTQPIFSERALENLKRARRELKGLIYGGLMPVVSHRNALFLTNEITGMDIPQDLIEQYRGLSRQEAEDLAVKLTLKMAEEISGYVDGYYLMTPFKRVSLSCRILENLRKMN